MKLRRATIDDMDLILEWRNDRQSVKNSISGKPVSGIDHLAWFPKAIKDVYCEIYIAMEDVYPVGVVRFDYAKKDRQYPEEWVVSIMVDPSVRGAGHGKEMLRIACNDKRCVQLRAFIFEHNTPSQKIFESCGFINAGCVDTSGGVLMTYIKGAELPLESTPSTHQEIVK